MINCDLLAPDDPGTKTLDKLSTLLSAHFEPPRIEIAERFHFRKREQAPGETIAEYDAALPKLATHCNFAANLETELRDQIVCGLQQESVQRHLLTKAGLMYKKMIEIVQAAESVEKSAKTLCSTTTPMADQVILLPRTSPPQGQQKDCFRCGGSHKPMDCRFKTAVCHFCKKRGHIARACITEAKQVRGKQTHCLQRETEEAVEQDPQGEVYDLYHVAEKKRHPYMVQVAINGAPLIMEVDMGASMSLISGSTYRQLWETPPELVPTSTRLRTYSGQPLTMLGTIKVTIEYEGQQVTQSLIHSWW